MRNFEDTITLLSGSNLIMGHCPKKLKMRQIARKISEQPTSKRDFIKNGLFDANTANYNTYYPDVSEKDLAPKEKDFINPIFRALSKVVVHRDWNPVDFGQDNILKNSRALLYGQTVNVDHEIAVGNAIGAVSAVFWQEEYKTSGGIIVPGGINSRLKIDGKSHPRIARAVMMDPPAIHSTSVTVRFMWTKSHPDMSDESFFKQLGGFDKDGKLIRRIATEVRQYPEISLVSHGADPFAQRVGKNGEINNPQYAATEMNSAKAAKQRKAQKYFAFDYKTDLIYNSKKSTIPKKSNTKSQTGMKSKTSLQSPVIVLLALHLGLTLDAKDPNSKDNRQKISQALKAMKKKSGMVKELKNQLAERDSEVAKATKQISNLKKKMGKVELLEKFKTRTVGKVRKETIRNYTLSVQGNTDEKIMKMLNSTDLKTLEGLNATYTVELEKKFPAACGDCGGNNISRSSAVAEKFNKKKRKLGDNELQDAFEKSESRKAINFMHN